VFDNILKIFTGRAERGDREADISKLKVKSGFDSSGMPYIDLTDKDTATIYKEKLKAFEGIKITR